MADDEKWRQRFQLFMGARLLGLATFLAGLAVMFTDVVRAGGWPVVGSILMILGLIDAVVAPRLLKKRWDVEDREQ